LIVAFAFIGAYVLLTGIASSLEKPVGGRLAAFQLNAAIRAGACLLGGAALALGPTVFPPLPSLLAALGIGVVSGIGSVSYCFAVEHLPLWMVVSIANSYILVTVLLGLTLLHEPIGVLTVVGLVLTIGGVLLISARPRSGVSSSAGSPRAARSRSVAYAVLAANILLVGVATFLEKPALAHGLAPLQLNAYVSLGNLAVALTVLAVRRVPVQLAWPEAAGLGLGGVFGLAVIFYFLALNRLPVSVAAPTSNSYVVLTVLLSVVLLGESLGWRRIGGIVLTLAGVALLAASAP
jgi:drug/metabolite transporter (DMT)-like permease